MKRLLFVFFAVLTLSACNFVADEEAESESQEKNTVIIPSADEFSTFVPSVSGQIFKIDANTSKISISTDEDLSGKSVYYAVVNRGTSKIAKEYARYIGEKDSASRSAAGATYEPEFDDEEEEDSSHFHDYFFPEFAEDNSRAAVSESQANVENLSLEVGKTTKQIYVRLGKDYSREKATLYAFNDVCNIWILDGDAFLATEKQKSEISAVYAQKFAAIYPVIRNVFGKESDSIYVSTSGNKDSMEKISETGTKVNIVLYDIAGDAASGGTIGLFSSMDYYKNGLEFSNVTVNRSNEGKYFYIDSYFAVKQFDYSLSTLAHEFQHMINFSVKSMNGIPCDSNLNEMLSMLCEDMMQNYLGISDDYSPRNRIRTFIKKYYSTGIRNYDESLVAYANAYIFGAWLTREFGGAAFVQKMMSNGKSNNDCIASAVNAVTGKNQTFDEIFGEFVKAVFNPEDSSFVRDAEENLSFGSYSYPMKGFANFQCPVIFENLAVSALPASYGVVLKKYGEIANGEKSVKLNLESESGMTNTDVVVYVCIK